MVAIVFEFSRVCFGAELARHRATIELLGALSTNPPWYEKFIENNCKLVLREKRNYYILHSVSDFILIAHILTICIMAVIFSLGSYKDLKSFCQKFFHERIRFQ